MRFINDDIKIKADTRRAKKISEAELARMMFERAVLITDTPEGLEGMSATNLIQGDSAVVDYVLRALLRLDSTIDRDNKYNVRTYHCTTKILNLDADVGSSLAGFHTINGLTFFGFFAGDAWDYATFMVVYYNSRHLRLYTPIRGNFINTDYHTVLGNELDVAVEDFIARFGMFGGERYSLADTYVQKYGFEKMSLKKIGFHWDAIREDILTTIKVI